MGWPTFLVIGAAKAGTTSLYHYLRQHPEVAMSAVKEPSYFAFAGETLAFTGPGDDWLNAVTVTEAAAYQALFTAEARAQGEASPLHLYSPQAPARMHRAVPGLRLCAVLRNPAERAYSHYWHFRTLGREPLADFSAALDAEAQRRADGWDWGWRYTDLGFYEAQLARYAAHFPPEQLLVLRYEALAHDPVGTVQRVYDHIGVDPTFTPDVTLRHNASGQPRSPGLHALMTGQNPVRSVLRHALPLPAKRYLATRLRSANLQKPPLTPALRHRLVQTFRPDLLRLQDRLGWDLSDWLTA